MPDINISYPFTKTLLRQHFCIEKTYSVGQANHKLRDRLASRVRGLKSCPPPDFLVLSMKNKHINSLLIMNSMFNDYLLILVLYQNKVTEVSLVNFPQTLCNTCSRLVKVSLLNCLPAHHSQVRLAHAQFGISLLQLFLHIHVLFVVSVWTYCLQMPIFCFVQEQND